MGQAHDEAQRHQLLHSESLLYGEVQRGKRHARGHGHKQQEEHREAQAQVAPAQQLQLDEGTGVEPFAEQKEAGEQRARAERGHDQRRLQPVQPLALIQAHGEQGQARHAQHHAGPVALLEAGQGGRHLWDAPLHQSQGQQAQGDEVPVSPAPIGKAV